MDRTLALVLLLAATFWAGCTENARLDPTEKSPTTTAEARLTVTSSVFTEGGDIPRRHACAQYRGGGEIVMGDGPSPPLRIVGLPEGAKSLAILMDDPDADGFVHWQFWNLPASKTDLAEGADVDALGGREGGNDAGQNGYYGPCPPAGKHKYVFTVYALDVESVSGISQAQSKAVAQGTLSGTFTRPVV